MGTACFRRRVMAVSLLLAAPAALGASDRLGNLDDRLLAAHNRERGAMGVGDLAWDAQLAGDAAEWARYLAATRSFEHFGIDPLDPDPQGENLWLGTKGYYSPEAMVDLWSAGKTRYHPGRFPDVSTTGRMEDVGHYTQVMWRETTHVGCAMADDGEDEYLVCRYSTAGNLEGEEPF